MTLKEQTVQLYSTVFKDDPHSFVSDFINRYFENNCRYTVKDGKIVSMLFLLEGEIKADGRVYPAAYLYAAATHPDYRMRGLMKDLIEKAKQETVDKGIVLATKPAEQSLYGYYARFGFETRFFSSSPAPLGDAESLTAEQYLKLREELLKDVPHLYLTDTDFLLDGLKLVGNSEFCAATDMSDGKCQVKEYISKNTDPRKGEIPFAMLITPEKVNLPQKLYFGLAMD